MSLHSVCRAWAKESDILLILQLWLAEVLGTPQLACRCGEMLAGVLWGCLWSSDAPQRILFSHAGKLETRMRRVGDLGMAENAFNKNKVTHKHNCRFWQSNIYWLFIFSPWNSFQQPKYVGNRGRTSVELNNHLMHHDNNPFAVRTVNIDRISCKLFSASFFIEYYAFSVRSNCSPVVLWTVVIGYCYWLYNTEMAL